MFDSREPGPRAIRPLGCVAGAIGLLLALVLPIAPLSAGADEIEIAPTTGDQLPAAILGEGGAPKGESLAYFSANPATRGYLAVPGGETRRGAVVLIHEWDGLTDRIRQMADSFAAEGLVALAADLYSGRTGSNRQENMALVRETLADEEQIIANLDAAVAYLRSRPDVNGKVAAIGWCYGGGVALSFALGGQSHEGTAIFYGSLLDDPERMKHIHHEIYGTFAALDRRPSPNQVDAFVKAMRQAGIENDVHVYDDVGHGFWLHVDRDRKTAEAPALDAWRRLKSYLERTLQ
ncbi:MAG: dienelactone hydrolase family protein [bacterium]